jgi:hypothetical protein
MSLTLYIDGIELEAGLCLNLFFLQYFPTESEDSVIPLISRYNDILEWFRQQTSQRRQA